MAPKLRAVQMVKHGNPRWLVDIPHEMLGKRQRKFFLDEGSALDFIDTFTTTIREHGRRGLELQDGLSVSDALKRFFRQREKDAGKHNLRLAHFWLDKFEAKHAAINMRAICADDLMAFWERGGWSANSQKQAYAYLRLFFNWAERRDYVDKNPARRVDPPKGTKPARKILAPHQLLELLNATEGSLRAYLCLGAFAGLRTSEILSGQIAIEGKEIHVQDGKTGGRYVAALPAFWRYWPGAHEIVREKTFHRRRAALVRSLGWTEWPENCLRHSFASYHLAMWEDAGKTAYQLGHTSTQMVYKAYARAVKKPDAVAWWSLGEPEDGKIVVIPGRAA